MVSTVSPVDNQLVTGVDLERMINSSKIDTLGVSETSGAGSPLRADPPDADVEKFKRLMSDTPETRQASEGDATKKTEKDIDTIVNEYMATLKQKWGTEEFERRKNEAFPGGNVKDVDFAKYLFNFEMYIFNVGNQNLTEFRDRLKETEL
jgi:hypothetical protein